MSLKNIQVANRSRDLEASMREADNIDVFPPFDSVHLTRFDPFKVRRITNPVNEVRSFCVITLETGNAADLNRNSAFHDRISMINEVKLIVKGIFDVQSVLSRYNKILTLWMRFSRFQDFILNFIY